MWYVRYEHLIMTYIIKKILELTCTWYTNKRNRGSPNKTKVPRWSSLSTEAIQVKSIVKLIKLKEREGRKDNIDLLPNSTLIINSS